MTDLTKQLDLRKEIDDLHDKVHGLQAALDAAVNLHEIPIELCHTLRAPEDEIHPVEFTIDKHRVIAVLQPLGSTAPNREVAVWRELLAIAKEPPAAGEHLRSMDPALLVIRMDRAVLVINTVHPRPLARAAIRMTRTGAALPLPIAWLHYQGRKHPTTVTIAVLMAGTAAATIALALVNSQGQLHAGPSPTATPPSGIVAESRLPTLSPPATGSPAATPPATIDPYTSRQTPAATTPSSDTRPADEDIRPTTSTSAERTAEPTPDTGEPDAGPPDDGPPLVPEPSNGQSDRPQPKSTRSATAPKTETPDSGPSTPKPSTSSPGDPPGRECGLVDTVINLPVVGVDVCL
ncbi:hypothetical protein ACIBEJ_00910 [Nonomuraea sp. NPDC050790]|uniref:hypothetical protein n=1 Tax=Nonomuraea sp. NPDC050790 TaxID=3364371 RepID=UPI0037B035D9